MFAKQKWIKNRCIMIWLHVYKCVLDIVSIVPGIIQTTSRPPQSSSLLMLLLQLVAGCSSIDSFVLEDSHLETTINPYLIQSEWNLFSWDCRKIITIGSQQRGCDMLCTRCMLHICTKRGTLHSVQRATKGEEQGGCLWSGYLLRIGEMIVSN